MQQVCGQQVVKDADAHSVWESTCLIYCQGCWSQSGWNREAQTNLWKKHIRLREGISTVSILIIVITSITFLKVEEWCAIIFCKEQWRHFSCSGLWDRVGEFSWTPPPPTTLTKPYLWQTFIPASEQLNTSRVWASSPGKTAFALLPAGTKTLLYALFKMLNKLN